jgi:hypothetical protein
MNNDQTSLDRACELSGKMDDIHYCASNALGDLLILEEWIGEGKSRKTLAMQSLVVNIEKRLASIMEDSK